MKTKLFVLAAIAILAPTATMRTMGDTKATESAACTKAKADMAVAMVAVQKAGADQGAADAEVAAAAAELKNAENDEANGKPGFQAAYTKATNDAAKAKQDQKNAQNEMMKAENYATAAHTELSQAGPTCKM